MLKRLTLVVVLVLSTTAKAEEGTLLLEQLVKQDPIEQKLLKFLKKHRVKKPEFYAKILTLHPMPVRKKKIMAAIIVPESRGDANAVNRWSGAAGTWQVMPFWKRQLKIKGSLLDPVTNLHAASRVYDIHAKEVNYNERKTLEAYSGRTPGYADKVLELASQI